MAAKRKVELQPRTVADRLRKWRAAKGWTRKQAAEHLGISWRTLEAYELGYRQPPSLGLLDKLWGTRSPE